MTFAQLIRGERTKRNLVQKTVSKDIEISTAFLYELETLNIRCSENTIRKLSEYYELNFDLLLKLNRLNETRHQRDKKKRLTKKDLSKVILSTKNIEEQLWKK